MLAGIGIALGGPGSTALQAADLALLQEIVRIPSVSGDEARCRACVKSKPDATLLLCDEPSLGLAPIITQNLFKILGELRDEMGMALLVVEQNAGLSLQLCDRAYVLETGRIVMEDTCKRLAEKEDIREFYRGIKEAGVRGPRIFFQGAVGDQSVFMPPADLGPGEEQHVAWARLLGDSIDALPDGPAMPSPRLAAASSSAT